MAREAADLYLVNENFYLTGLGYNETRCDVMRQDETRQDETRQDRTIFCHDVSSWGTSTIGFVKFVYLIVRQFYHIQNHRIIMIDSLMYVRRMRRKPLPRPWESALAKIDDENLNNPLDDPAGYPDPSPFILALQD